jgi:N-acetyl-anhydromuramyl-L-alanine amidase AmpD
MHRKQLKGARIKGSILKAVPIGVLCVIAGFGGYKLLHSDKEIQTQGSSAVSTSSTKETSWPQVQYLSITGLNSLTEDQLFACSKAINAGVERSELANSTNYGNRDARDAIGRDIPNKPELIVIHETVITASETINLFKTPHPKDEDQASYHVLVERTGELVRIVPDENRAYGSGYSKFGDFTVHSKSPDNFSINNVALHISLESPADGQKDTSNHSGYTKNQYSSLAKKVLLWQAKYGIPVFRITTHASVDRSHSRYDPRSFRWDELDFFHRRYAKTCAQNILTLPT